MIGGQPMVLKRRSTEQPSPGRESWTDYGKEHPVVTAAARAVNRGRTLDSTQILALVRESHKSCESLRGPLRRID